MRHIPCYGAERVPTSLAPVSCVVWAAMLLIAVWTGLQLAFLSDGNASCTDTPLCSQPCVPSPNRSLNLSTYYFDHHRATFLSLWQTNQVFGFDDRKLCVWAQCTSASAFNTESCHSKLTCRFGDVIHCEIRDTGRKLPERPRPYAW